MIEVNGWMKVSEEDIWETGCETGTSDFGGNAFTADTQEELIEKLAEFCGGAKSENILLNACEKNGRIDIQRLEDKNGDEATEEQIKLWKEGHKRLWNVTYIFEAENVTRSPFTFATGEKNNVTS